jgi:hypothetical protein
LKSQTRRIDRLLSDGLAYTRCLNHKLQSKVARVYIRDRRQAEQAKAFDKFGALLGQLTGSTQGAANG